jgi:predicted molibdopterin-dependent oxidoreductase YjgC
LTGSGMLNVRAIINLALSRGMVGRPKTGLTPIRGQSGVQGGAEVGVSPDSLPSGLPLNEENVKKFSELWGFTVPSWRGLTVPEMVEAAAKDKLDILYAIGGGLSEVLPDKQYVEKALSNIPLRIHHDIVLNRKMLLPPRDTVVILPATTRYEMEGGCTITTTERRIVYSPEIKGPRLTEALEEWKVLVELAKRVKPWLADKITFNNTREIREDIARAVPLYDGIQYLSKKGDNVQWGGERLCEGWSFNTEDGKARFYPVEPPETTPPTNMFILTTRRGKQFNSMLLSNRDMLTGCSRFQVIMNIDDMAELGLRSGDEVVLRSQTGILRGVVMQGNIRTRTIMAYWPECNTLIERRYDENTMIPAYRGGYVEVKPAKKSED